jgi:hypothetical protein
MILYLSVFCVLTFGAKRVIESRYVNFTEREIRELLKGLQDRAFISYQTRLRRKLPHIPDLGRCKVDAGSIPASPEQGLADYSEKTISQVRTSPAITNLCSSTLSDANFHFRLVQTPNSIKTFPRASTIPIRNTKCLNYCNVRLVNPLAFSD